MRRVGVGVLGFVFVAFLISMPLVGALPRLLPPSVSSTSAVTATGLPDIASQTGVSSPFSDRAAPATSAPTSVPGLPRVPQPGSPLIDDPLYRFLTAMGPDPDAVPAKEKVALMEQLFRDLGFTLPNRDEINESATLSFTHPVGDVDGDGTEDVAFDIFCVDWDVCIPPRSLTDLSSRWCRLGHWMEVRSGRDGSEIWKWRLDRPNEQLVVGPVNVGSIFACSWEFVIGTVPASDGTSNIVVYRFQSFFTIHHDIYLLSAHGDGNGNGKILWHYEKDGFVIWSCLFSCLIYGNQTFLLPILQTPPRQGVNILEPGTQTTLHVRAIGYIIYFDGVLIFDYEPVEWAARLDLKTGDAIWERNTFQPDPLFKRSVFPVSYTNSYWFRESCCWDQTGDLVPDLFFTTYEWDPIPFLQNDTFRIGTRAVVFDAKNGDRVWSTVLEPGTPVGKWKGLWRFYATWVSPLGDANADSRSDFLHVNLYVNYTPSGDLVDFDFHLAVRDGQDGHTIWKMLEDKWLDPLVLGDSNRDGGNDFLLAYYDIKDDFAGGLVNVTDTRLVVWSGDDGSIVWETATKTAPIDLIFMFINSRKNGLADLDNDNVGDIWVDQPDQKDDLTVVHHQNFLAGSDGHLLHEVAAVGAYAFPISAGDLDGDQGNDFSITQGDTVDLWITTDNGNEGQPIWSRRLMAIPISGATLSIPLLRYHTMELDGNVSTKDQLLSFSMYVFSCGGGFCVGGFYQQHQAIQGHTGKIQWAMPFSEEGDESLYFGQPTPATVLYTGWTSPVKVEPKSLVEAVRVPVMMGVSSVASLGVAFVVVRRRWGA